MHTCILFDSNGLSWVRCFDFSVRLDSKRYSFYGSEIRSNSNEICDKPTQRQEVCDRCVCKTNVWGSWLKRSGSNQADDVGTDWTCWHFTSWLHSSKSIRKIRWRACLWWSDWLDICIQQVSFYSFDSRKDRTNGQTVSRCTRCESLFHECSLRDN